MEGYEREKELESALEQVNLDYLKLRSSPDYRHGHSIRVTLETLRAFNLPLFFQKMENRIRINAASKEPRRSPFPVSEKRNAISSDERTCIYTCVTNGYDSVQDPVYDPGLYDGYEFSDEAVTSPFWKFVPLDTTNPELVKNPNRYIKLHPFAFSNSYDYAIYVDGSVSLVSNIIQFAEVAKAAPSGFAIHTHGYRDCVYEEGEYCIKIKRGNPNAIRPQLNRYEREGFPHHYGLFEATVFAVDLHNETARMIFAAWWDELMLSGSGRDQLALPYVLWKLNVPMTDIGILGHDVQMNPKLRIAGHESRQWDTSHL